MKNRRQSKRSEFKKVRLERKSLECNDRGQPVGGWDYIREIYVCAVPLSSYERTINNAESNGTRWRIEILHVTGLTADDRILWQGRWLEFNGRPYQDGKRCRRLLVNASELDCTPEELEACECQTTK